VGNNRRTSLVAPPKGDRPLFEQGLTLIQPYFGEVKRFNFMYDRYWSAYPRSIKDKLHIILVDDCGTPPIHELMQGRVCDFNLSIFRITDDLKYNTAGALNVGSIEAKTDFILQMDSDCALEARELYTLMLCSPLNGHIYKFRRNRITDNPERKALTRFLPCANLLHKDVFAGVGGFDEDFTGSRSGGYGFFDNHFDWKIRENGGIIAVIDGIVVTEYMEGLVEDKPTGPMGVGVYRTNDQNRINKQLYRAKQRDPSLNNYTILRFDYEKVYSNE
jgi:hypothetical protein